MAPVVPGDGLSKERLDEIVDSLKEAISHEDIRKLSQRAVQAKVWHMQPKVAAYMTHLRHEEEKVRSEIMKKISNLVYNFHNYTLDATLARAGVIEDDRGLHAGTTTSLLEEAAKEENFDLLCLDAKERLYLILKKYGWLSDFFRYYPQHFYENSFQFVHRIPDKKLTVKVKVVGLGIGGSMAVSGLAKAGVVDVVGYEKRDRTGGSRAVGSRYQNASWRAYDVAERLLDQQAYDHLISYRQRLNIKYDDGTTKIVTADRVQIILGSAIEAALESAERYGAKLNFGTSNETYYDSGTETDNSTNNGVEEADIVALFAGAHTSELFPGLKEQMDIFSWPELSSTCKMWLQIRESKHREAYCTRGGEIGAQKWHYSIESARKTVQDIVRIRNNLNNQYKVNMERLSHNTEVDTTEEQAQALTDKFNAQLAQIDAVWKRMEERKDNGDGGARFDYIFTNAPDNNHNRSKRNTVGEDGSVVIDGGYTVDIKIASRSKIGGSNSTSPDAKELLRRFSTDLIVLGGDACVPPNPLAAYGATLACEAADMLVQLAIGHGHLNSILVVLEKLTDDDDDSEHLVDWIRDVRELKDLLSEYYDARSRSENYFQFVQSLICNLYSLPPMA